MPASTAEAVTSTADVNLMAYQFYRAPRITINPLPELQGLVCLIHLLSNESVIGSSSNVRPPPIVVMVDEWGTIALSHISLCATLDCA